MRQQPDETHDSEGEYMTATTVAELWYMREHQCSLTAARIALAALEKQRLDRCLEQARAVSSVNWLTR